MSNVILLVEDNPRDEAMTVRALRKSNILNEVVVAHDGVEALDYLFGTGTYVGRDTKLVPQLVLLDLKMPRVDGLEVLRGIRAHESTRRLPVVVFTSIVTILAQTAMCASRWTSISFWQPRCSWACTGWS
jgi:two-component system, response regulator